MEHQQARENINAKANHSYAECQHFIQFYTWKAKIKPEQNHGAIQEHNFSCITILLANGRLVFPRSYSHYYDKKQTLALR